MVAAYTQLLSEKYQGKLDADADRYIHYATDGALRMQPLIEGLLAFSRVGGGSAADEPVASLALEEALLNLSHTIVESGAVTHCGLLPTVRAEGKCHQVSAKRTACHFGAGRSRGSGLAILGSR